MALGRVLLLLLGVCAAAAVPQLSRLRFDHDSRSLLRADAEQDERERLLAERFGSDDILLVAWEVDDALAPETFARIQTITRDLAAIDGLEELYSIASPTVLLPLGGALPRPIQPSDLESETGRSRVARALRASPVYVGTICNVELNVVAAAGTLAAGPRDEREEVIRAVRAVAAKHGTAKRPLFVSGVTALALAASEYAVQDLVRVGGAALLVAVLVLLLLCGSARETLVAVVATGLPPLLALGLAGFLGWPITALGAALFPILAVVGITSSVHLLNAFDEERAQAADLAQAARAAARRVALPITLSLLTTAGAFVALRATGVPAFRSGGLLVAAGIAIAIPVILVALPAMLALVKPPRGRRLATRLDAPLGRLLAWSLRHRRAVVAGALLLAAVCVPLVARVGVQVDVLQAFQPESEVARTYRFLEARLTATLPVDLVLEAKDVGSALADLRRFDADVVAIDGVQSALGLQSLVEYGKSMTPFGDAAALAFLRTALSHVTERFEHRPSGSYRIKVRVHEGTPPTVLDEIDAARARAESGPSWLTGLYLRAVQTTRALVGDLARGLALMIGAVTIAIALALRSVRLGLAALLPNMLAPLVVFAVASAGGFALDVSAVAVASVAVGLAVDDTFHVLHAVARDRRRGLAMDECLARTQSSVGRALVLSTVVLAAGLACLLASRFLPTARFGLLAAGASVAALLADLIVLPAALSLFRRL
ncbi:MAG: MMPL family transporter [Planctomycetota bacterium]